MPLNFRTTNVLFGERLALEDDAGNGIDLGHVGHVTRVDRTTIGNLCYAGIVPVIPSMCLDADGQKLTSTPTPRPRPWPRLWGPRSCVSERRQRRAPRQRTIPTR